MFNDKTLNVKLRKATKRFEAKNGGQSRYDSRFFKDCRSGKTVTPVTAFEKNYALCHDYKKLSVTMTIKDRLKALKRLANEKLDGSPLTYNKRRKKKHRTKKLCAVCKQIEAVCQHHIIQLQHGGFDNGINRIPICDDCHCEIHPWMRKG